MSQQPGINNIYLHGKDPCEVKYQFLINKREITGIKHWNDTKAFIEYSNDMVDKNIKILKNTTQTRNAIHNRFWWYSYWYV